jgi:exopolysaccharide biosynthesis polyprenyl glycosylphosphotransferase
MAQFVNSNELSNTNDYSENALPGQRGGYLAPAQQSGYPFPPGNINATPLEPLGNTFVAGQSRNGSATTTPEIPTGGTTGQITRVISARRSTRRQWRMFEIGLTFVVDALLIYAAFYLAYYLRYKLLLDSSLIESFRNNVVGGGGDRDHVTQFSDFFPLEIGIIIGGMLIFILRGLYSIRLSGSLLLQIRQIVASLTLGLSLMVAYFFVIPSAVNSRLLVPFVWICAIVTLSLGRVVLSLLMGLLHRVGLGERRLLVVGSGRLGKMIMQHIAASPNLGYSIVGFLHDMHEPPGDFGRFRMLGTLEDLALVIRSMQVDEVIIALPSELHQQTIRSVRLCERLGASFMLVPELYELSLSRIDMVAIEGIPLLGIKQKQINTIQRAIMRLTDIVGAVLVLILGAPLWLCFALLVKLTSPGEVILRQTRIGVNGRPFTCYKFRSMYKNAEQMLAALLERNEAQGPLFKMKDDPRVTPIGKFLRRTSLDEIPQLFNVIKGDMSLVGPRPPLPREVAQYEEWQKNRLAVKPGLTGLWQVRGRSDLSFDEGVLMDLYYIENWSLRLYYQILLRTVPAVLFSRGAY